MNMFPVRLALVLSLVVFDDRLPRLAHPDVGNTNLFSTRAYDSLISLIHAWPNFSYGLEAITI